MDQQDQKYEKPAISSKYDYILHSSNFCRVLVEKCDHLLTVNTKIIKQEVLDEPIQDYVIDYEFLQDGSQFKYETNLDQVKKEIDIINGYEHTSTIECEYNYIEKSLRCVQSNECFASSSGPRNHIETHKNQVYESNGSDNKSFSFKKHMNLGINSIKNLYTCDLCNQTFSRKTVLKAHLNGHVSQKTSVRRVHYKTWAKRCKEKKVVKCEFCCKTFSCKSSFEIHMRAHTKEKPFSCELCSNVFSQKGDLKRHLMIHTGEKPYKCKVCKKAFSRNGELNRHMKVHTGERPHLCKICSKAFSRLGDFNRHIMIHTGEKPYKCDVCDKAFNRRGDLKVHLNNHVKKRNSKCNVCHKSFIRKKDLIIHSATHT